MDGPIRDKLKIIPKNVEYVSIVPFHDDDDRDYELYDHNDDDNDDDQMGRAGASGVQSSVKGFHEA